MSSPHVCTESRFRGETISVNLCPSPRVLSLPWCQSFLYQAQSRPVEEATGASWISSTPVKTVQTSATHQQNNGRLPCGIRVLRWLRSPGRGSLSFLPFLSTLCFHPPCFIGGLSGSPADTTACLVSRFARDDGASGRQSKISPIPPGLPENSTEARFAAQHTRGRVRVSLWSTRLRSSGGAGSEGTPRKARPIRGDGTTSGRSRHTLVRAHADHACATHTSACRSRVRNADMVSGGVAHPGRCSCGALWAPAQKRANVAPPSFPS